MRQALLSGVSALLLAVLLPGWLLRAQTQDRAEPVVLIIDLPAEKENPPVQPERMVRVRKGAETLQLPLEEYLVGVVLSEMPASFAPEALKAQAVAARTFTLRQMTRGGKHDDCDLCADSTCCQAWTTREELAAKLGASWNGYWEKASAAVEETSGQVLTYGGELIEAVYFSCSGGTTEDAAAVWGSEVPYLQSVSSDGEENASKYRSQVTVSLETFCRRITEAAPEAKLSGKPMSWFGETQRTEGGGVESMQIGGVAFRGTELRTMFHLNSTKFSVAVTGDGIEFDVLGYGHRVGMSQYGANAMAQEGYDYQQILAHYYTGAEVTQAEQ